MQTMQTTTTRNVNYEMFSPAGERACQSLVNKVSKKILGPSRLTKDDVQKLYDDGREKISEKHEEVYDTEPRWNISREINKALREAGYGFRINGWGSVEEGQP